MKSLKPPTLDDGKVLEALSKQTRISSYPDLKNNLKTIKKRYQSYIRDRKEKPNSKLPNPLTLPPSLADAMKLHYASPPTSVVELEFIADLRKRGSPDVCPMCGSLGTGTLDHIFPRHDYPEFSVFSKNLVPACICNSKRSTNLTGQKQGQRILHPYYDPFLSKRLVRAKITDTATSRRFRKPVFELVIGKVGKKEEKEAVKFHVDKVLRKTQVFEWFEATWVKILRNPENHFFLSTRSVCLNEFKKAVKDSLYRMDLKYGTPNNWESMLLAGISATPSVVTFLHQHLLDLESGRIRKEDI